MRNTPEPQYQIVQQDREFEIRAYPPMLIAETQVSGTYREVGGIAFQRLAAYIFGANTRRESMAMTTPVIREAKGEEMAMTAPVLRQGDGRQWKMSFVMPAGYRLDTLPVPLDANVQLKELPAKKVAALRYSGSPDENTITTNSQKLLEWLDKQSLKPISSTRSAAYDPPWTLPLLRRNEIHVDIE